MAYCKLYSPIVDSIILLKKNNDTWSSLSQDNQEN